MVFLGGGRLAANGQFLLATEGSVGVGDSERLGGISDHAQDRGDGLSLAGGRRDSLQLIRSPGEALVRSGPTGEWGVATEPPDMAEACELFFASGVLLLMAGLVTVMPAILGEWCNGRRRNRIQVGAAVIHAQNDWLFIPWRRWLYL